MYKIFIKNLEGFSEIFKNDERLSIAKPLYLLKDLNEFNKNQRNNTILYQNLYAIINKATELKIKKKYHNFGMFLNELDLQYYEFKTPVGKCEPIDQEMLDSQLSLLHQFMYPAYYS